MGMDGSLKTKREEIMTRVWGEKEFSSLGEFTEALQKFPEFSDLLYDSIYRGARAYLSKIGKGFKHRVGGRYVLSDTIRALRKIHIDDAMRDLNESGNHFPSAWCIARRLVGDNAFGGCKSIEAITGWVKKYLNSKKELARPAPKTKQNQKAADFEKKSNLALNSADTFDLVKVSDNFLRGHEYVKSSFEALCEETISLRLRVLEYRKHVCPDISAVYAQLGEKDMELQRKKTRCGELEFQLASTNEKIAVLMAQTRDPDEELKYELREKSEEIQKLNEKIIFWERRCDALTPKPPKIDPLRHMVFGGEVKRN